MRELVAVLARPCFGPLMTSCDQSTARQKGVTYRRQHAFFLSPCGAPRFLASEAYASRFSRPSQRSSNSFVVHAERMAFIQPDPSARSVRPSQTTAFPSSCFGAAAESGLLWLISSRAPFSLPHSHDASPIP